MPLYVLDANVFIEAAMRYYAFDLAPAFWKHLVDQGTEGQICTIDRIAAEITGTVIIDEAHSSQSGEAATDLKGILTGEGIKKQAREEAEAKGLPDHEEEILKTLAKRQRQPNISFFAFTATPKYKTLEFFGQTGADGKPHPFHLYSMRQAIEEGFILDVLKNYTTYKAYYRLLQTVSAE